MKVSSAELKKLNENIVALYTGSTAITSYKLHTAAKIQLDGSIHSKDFGKYGCFVSGYQDTAQTVVDSLRKQVTEWLVEQDHLEEEQTL
jgi:hypothetical protein